MSERRRDGRPESSGRLVHPADDVVAVQDDVVVGRRCSSSMCATRASVFLDRASSISCPRACLSSASSRLRLLWSFKLDLGIAVSFAALRSEPTARRAGSQRRRVDWLAERSVKRQHYTRFRPLAARSILRPCGATAARDVAIGSSAQRSRVEPPPGGRGARPRARHLSTRTSCRAQLSGSGVTAPSLTNGASTLPSARSVRTANGNRRRRARRRKETRSAPSWRLASPGSSRMRSSTGATRFPGADHRKSGRRRSPARRSRRCCRRLSPSKFIADCVRRLALLR